MTEGGPPTGFEELVAFGPEFSDGGDGSANEMTDL
jgi:hypothetical protein